MKCFSYGLVLFLALLLSAGAVLAQVYVTDGDTIRLSGSERIRIIGLDAPETRRAKCDYERRLGYEAKARLIEIIKSGEMRILRQGQDRYGRTLAIVRVGGRDVAKILIAEKLARPYSGGRRRGWCNR